MGVDKSVSWESVNKLMRARIKNLHDKVDELNESLEAGVGEAGSDVVLSALEKKILGYLAKYPFVWFSALREGMGVESGFRKVMVRLERLGYVDIQNCVGSGKTGKADYFPLTDKAYDLFGTPAGLRISPRLFEHTMWCDWVRRWIVKRGWTAFVEYGKRGVLKRADVYCRDRDTAYEITRSFGNLVENVFKCLTELNVGTVVVVCETLEVVGKKAMPELEAKLPPDLLERVEFMSIRQFLGKGVGHG